MPKSKPFRMMSSNIHILLECTLTKSPESRMLYLERSNVNTKATKKTGCIVKIDEIITPYIVNKKLDLTHNMREQTF